MPMPMPILRMPKLCLEDLPVSNEVVVNTILAIPGAQLQKGRTDRRVSFTLGGGSTVTLLLLSVSRELIFSCDARGLEEYGKFAVAIGKLAF